jgi:hypothetical protein
MDDRSVLLSRSSDISGAYEVELAASGALSLKQV